MKKWILFLSMICFLQVVKANVHNTPKPAPKQIQQQPSNCIKQPEIIKKNIPKQEAKQQAPPEKPKPSTAQKNSGRKELENSYIPHFSIFNFFNTFYTKDTLDRLQVM